ncbi:GSCOCG00013149001-RA-CDS, partial [Cotesia congregata]
MEIHERWRKKNIERHACELKRQTSSSQLKRLPPNAKLIARLKRKFQKLIIVYEEHPFAKYHLRSRAAIAFEKKRHNNSQHWWILHPYSKLGFFWDKVMTVVLLYFFLTVPYIKAFFRICDRPLNNQVYYVYPFFLIDLISSIPYTWFFNDDLISLKGNNQRNFIAFIGELLPLLKIFRLTTLRYYVKQINSTISNSNVYAIQSGLYKMEDTLLIYINSLHMGASNLIGSSFIELQKISPSDKLIRCILLLFGSSYTVYLIVVILQLIESSAEPELKYQDMKRQIREYIHKNDIPQELGDKFFLYNRYRFQGNYFKESTIINSLPNHLKQEIYIRSNNGLLEKAKIFHNLSKSFISNLMTALKPVIYLKDDVIYNYNTEGDCMYFITTKLREVSAIAVETCELLRLHRRNFNRLILPHSELHDRLSKISDDRGREIEYLNKLSKEEMT